MKEYFIRIGWDSSEWTYFKDQIALGLQQFFHVAVDLRTTTLLYCYVRKYEGSYKWGWDTKCPHKKNWAIVIQVNCSWLTRAIIAKCEDHGRMDKKHLLVLKCDDVEPEFKMLQIFFGGKHKESELEEVVEYDITNLVVLLQDRLILQNSDWEEEGRDEKLSAIVRERFQRSPGKVKESLKDWMIKKGFMAERRREEEEEGCWSDYSLLD